MSYDNSGSYHSSYSLARILGRKGFSKVMIPTTKNMSIMLPSAEEFGEVGASKHSHNQLELKCGCVNLTCT